MTYDLFGTDDSVHRFDFWHDYTFGTHTCVIVSSTGEIIIDSGHCNWIETGVFA